MMWTSKSTERKRYDDIQFRGNWHRKFLWFPTVIKEDEGIQTVLWLTTVMRKTRVDEREADNSFKAGVETYTTKEQLSLDILAGKDEQLIHFGTYGAEANYRRLLDNLGIDIPDKKNWRVSL